MKIIRKVLSFIAFCAVGAVWGLLMLILTCPAYVNWGGWIALAMLATPLAWMARYDEEFNTEDEETEEA